MTQREPQVGLDAWRVTLGRFVKQPAKKARVLNVLTSSTLARWLNGDARPRQVEKVESVLNALEPVCSLEERVHFAQELVVAGLLSPEQIPSISEPHATVRENDAVQEQIPETFYMRVFDVINHFHPALRAKEVCQLVLDQCFTHLNRNQCELMISILLCMPPFGSSSEIRSLREFLSIQKNQHGPGTEYQYDPRFLVGAESIASATYRELQSSVSRGEASRFQSYFSHPIASRASFPLLRGNKFAGCLFVVSSQPDFFSPLYRRILNNYATLIALAFRESTNKTENDFYPPEMIKLALISDLPIISTNEIWQRSIQLMQEKPDLVSTPEEAEAYIWHQIEEECIINPRWESSHH